MIHDRILFNQSDDVGEFVHQLVFGHQGSFGMSYAMGFLDQYGLLQAGAVFHNYDVHVMSVEITAAGMGSNWMSVERLNAIGSYVFGQLKCNSMVAKHDVDNRRARRLWTRIGGTEYLIKGFGGEGIDRIMHVLLASEAKASKFWR